MGRRVAHWFELLLLRPASPGLRILLDNIFSEIICDIAFLAARVLFRNRYYQTSRRATVLRYDFVYSTLHTLGRQIIKMNIVY